ncbi:MAG: transporter substrate-binding domain-containing protein [Desulfobacterales bacterium]|nr:transporter substrate-binding domain-containing protein [Desulfobacterales bacterium]
MTWAPTPEKKADVLFSDPVILHTKVFFHLKEFPFDWASLKDLKGLRIGATKEYTYGDEFDRAAKKGTISVEFVPRDIQNLKKLLGGRFDVFPSDIDVGYDLLNANFIPADISRVTHHPKPIQQTGTCVILTKSAPEKSQHLLERFNRGLEKLKANGEYHRMLEAARRGAYQPK